MLCRSFNFECQDPRFQSTTFLRAQHYLPPLAFWWQTGLKIDLLTSLWLHSPIQSFWHLPIIAGMNFSAACATISHPWDDTRWASHHPLYTSVHLYCCFFSDHFWYMLTIAYHEHPRRPVMLEMIWPSHLAITLVKITQMLSYTFFSASDTLTSRTDSSFTGVVHITCQWPDSYIAAKNKY